MKIQIVLLFGMLLLLAPSCSLYLPVVKDVPAYPYGSHAVIRTVTKDKIRGELIAVKGDTLYIKRQKGFDRGLDTLHTGVIKKMKVELAINSNHPGVYQIAPKITSGLSLMHGIYSVITIPANAILSPVLHPGKVVAMLQWEEIYKYCRYPQGMPAGLDAKDISTPPLEYRAPDFLSAIPEYQPVTSFTSNTAASVPSILVDHASLYLCLHEVGAPDGDVITVRAGGKMLLEKHTLNTRPVCFGVTLTPGDMQHFSVETLSGGGNVNDIVKIVIEDGDKMRTFYFETKEGQTAGVNLQLLK